MKAISNLMHSTSITFKDIQYPMVGRLSCIVSQYGVYCWHLLDPPATLLLGNCWRQHTALLYRIDLSSFHPQHGWHPQTHRDRDVSANAGLWKARLTEKHFILIISYFKQCFVLCIVSKPNRLFAMEGPNSLKKDLYYNVRVNESIDF